MKPLPSFAEFESAALGDGYDAVLERRWAPNLVLDEHIHPFEANALVVEGEMWLTVGDKTRHLHPGDKFQLDVNVPHSERYGSGGATYWVARRQESGTAH